MKTRNKAIPAAYLFLENDGKYLIARRANTGYQDGVYQVPAGHVEEGEHPSQAIIREAKEEIGIDIAPEHLRLFHVSYRPKHDETGDRADFFFTASMWTGQVTNVEPHKCDDLRWASHEELPENMTLHIREAFESLRSGRHYTEIGIDDLKKHGLYKLP